MSAIHSPVTMESALPSSSGKTASPGAGQGPQQVGISLDDNIVQKMAIGNVFSKESYCRINSLDFHRTADLLVRCARWNSGDSVSGADTDGFQRFLP